MGILTFNIEAAINQAPSVIGDNTINVLHDSTYTFTKANFTTETNPPYGDPDGDDVDKVKVTALLSPGTGALEYNSVTVTLNQEIVMTGIVSGLLKYISDSGTSTAYVEDFEFDISDLGSNTFSGLTGVMTLDVAAYVNLPPVTGDNTISGLAHAATHVFTSANFTTGTTPAYSDPETDAAEDLKVTSLPANGDLLLSGSPVVNNQIITFVDIAAGNFSYRATQLLTGARSVTFNFLIRDAGSGQFGT